MEYRHRYWGFWYRLETLKKKPRDNAEADCVSQGAHLATFHSQDELDSFNGKTLHHDLHLQLRSSVSLALQQLLYWQL